MLARAPQIVLVCELWYLPAFSACDDRRRHVGAERLGLAGVAERRRGAPRSSVAAVRSPEQRAAAGRVARVDELLWGARDRRSVHLGALDRAHRRRPSRSRRRPAGARASARKKLIQSDETQLFCASSAGVPPLKPSVSSCWLTLASVTIVRPRRVDRLQHGDVLVVDERVRGPALADVATARGPRCSGSSPGAARGRPARSPARSGRPGR